MTRRRIYVVDDEEPIRRATRLMLTVQGFEVAAFESGMALLEVADSLKPGAILLDIRMPGMDGLEVQQALNQRNAPHPVIVMTGHGDLAVATAALQGGAIAFLEKPFSRIALQQALDSAFNKLEDPPAFDREREAARARVLALPEADRSVLAGLARSLSNEAIAASLGVTATVIEARKARLFTELEVESIADALSLAFIAGFGPSQDE